MKAVQPSIWHCFWLVTNGRRILELQGAAGEARMAAAVLCK
jgi:hypothetical protein